VKAAVLPLVRKDGQPELAREALELLRRAGVQAEYDEGGSIGKRYRRQDEIGTPVRHHDRPPVLEDRTVTLRDRDSLAQERVPVDALADHLEAKLRRRGRRRRVCAALRDGRPSSRWSRRSSPTGCRTPTTSTRAARSRQRCARRAPSRDDRVVDGTVRVGLDEDALAVAAAGWPRRRPRAAAGRGRGASAATTVSATAHLAARAGIRVFATGGLGGVHRGRVGTPSTSRPTSSPSRARVCVVCSGVKSLLDVPATLERLETLGVRRAFGTDRCRASSCATPVAAAPAAVDRPEESRRCCAPAASSARRRARWRRAAIDEELDRELHDRVVDGGARRREGVRGADVTPAVLARIHAESRRASLRANVALVEGNARLARASRPCCERRRLRGDTARRRRRARARGAAAAGDAPADIAWRGGGQRANARAGSSPRRGTSPSSPGGRGPAGRAAVQACARRASSRGSRSTRTGRRARASCSSTRPASGRCARTAAPAPSRRRRRRGRWGARAGAGGRIAGAAGCRSTRARSPPAPGRRRAAAEPRRCRLSGVPDAEGAARALATGRPRSS
jgi:pseudouridine-5'-phosphate glycosidase